MIISSTDSDDEEENLPLRNFNNQNTSEINKTKEINKFQQEKNKNNISNTEIILTNLKKQLNQNEENSELSFSKRKIFPGNRDFSCLSLTNSIKLNKINELKSLKRSSSQDNNHVEDITEKSTDCKKARRFFKSGHSLSIDIHSSNEFLKDTKKPIKIDQLKLPGDKNFIGSVIINEKSQQSKETTTVQKNFNTDEIVNDTFKLPRNKIVISSNIFNKNNSNTIRHSETENISALLKNHHKVKNPLHEINITNKRKSTTINEFNNNNNNNSEDINHIIDNKKQKSNKMSVYDQRLQSDERSLSNGYMPSSRGSHNDDNPNTIAASHYYHCSQPIMATLCNIGNTCYLNSVVYTLRFAPLFLHKLHHLVEDLSHIHNRIGKQRVKSSSLGRNISGFYVENIRSMSSKDLASLENPTNCDIPKSNQQNATEKLHELYKSLHCNEQMEITEPFHADIFLNAIQEVSSIFEGNQQQDAHEFLMCVLDSIRETCQTLTRSITECPDVIANGFVSLPEQNETGKNQQQQQQQQQTQRESTSSSLTSFFSRKSKRKDDTKLLTSKLRLNLINNKDNNPTNNITDVHNDGINNTKSIDINDTTTTTTSSAATTAATAAGTMTTTGETTNNIIDKEKLNDKIKKLGLDFFTEDFEGITVSTTKCLSCETVTEQKETMVDIAVPIPSYETNDSKNKSHLFIQNSCTTPEYFRGDNKYRCEQCIGYTEAIRSISYEVLPRLLVIQLSRFSGGMEKINSYVPTPFTLQCFCSKCINSDKKKYHIYKLYSVITHVGATMSVGHYIAYTCSLDWANDYINCPKDRRKSQLNNSNLIIGNNLNNNNNNLNNNLINNNNNNIIINGGTDNNNKKERLLKKTIFGRNKASSSGDMSKNLKNLNGLLSSSSSSSTSTTASTQATSTSINKTSIINGVDKLNLNTKIPISCQSMNCCGIRLKNPTITSTTGYFNNTNYNNGSSTTIPTINSTTLTNDLYNIDLHQDDNLFNTNMYNDFTTINNQRKSNLNEPIWYMCDDDKIKLMSQREFEDLLSPNRKITITPYLLFYARNDLQ